MGDQIDSLYHGADIMVLWQSEIDRGNYVIERDSAPSERVGEVEQRESDQKREKQSKKRKKKREKGPEEKRWQITLEQQIDGKKNIKQKRFNDTIVKQGFQVNKKVTQRK